MTLLIYNPIDITNHICLLTSCCAIAFYFDNNLRIIF